MRRRKGSEGSASALAEKRPPAAAAGSMDVDESPGISDDGKAAAAAGDLLQLAAAASGVTGGRSRAAQPAQRSRDAKPYQRARAGGRGGRAGGGAGDDCWLPGGFWWQDSRTPMPSGRQPGELAGWSPLAGELNQQRLQEQRHTLSQKEQIVMGLGSRHDAAAYLQQLGGHASVEHTAGTVEGSKEVLPITTSVDDSVIDHSSTYKQLASWGGFRRHFKGEVADGRDEEEGDATPASQQGPHAATATPAPTPMSAPPLAASNAAAADAEGWKQRLHEQLVAKRAEIMATQQRLESLSLEQQELEVLYRAHN